ncbi:MAG: hypothetical protein JW940_01065 [Polyangiaceae bacterium]|nr:hypothetical protein [Polyangiaceae bacterium]
MTKNLLLTSLLAASLAACGAGDRDAPADSNADDPAEVALNRLLVVERANGNRVEFYEPVAGELVISEEGLATNPPLTQEIDLDAMSATDVYRQLRPGQEVPDVLVQAAQRARERAAELAAGDAIADDFQDEEDADHDPGEAAGRSSSIATAAQALVDDSECPWSWFASNIDACSRDGEWDVEWSHQTGTTWFQRNETWTTNLAVCSYRGSVTFTMKYKNSLRWETQGSWTVQEGTYRWASRTRTPPADFVVKSTVDNASGDGYHHCGCGWRT